MIFAPLGHSGLKVSRLGLGLAALGRPGYINLGHAADLDHNYNSAAMEAHCRQVLDAAWATGICYFDAARSYGHAESFLASWLSWRRIESPVVVVGSKWGYTYTANWRVQADKHEVKNHTLPVLQKQFSESQALLGPYLQLYQIHSATLESGVLDTRDVIDELKRMRESGLKLGLTLSGPNQSGTLKRAIEIGIFDCVQATWNLLEPSAAPALQLAHESGMGIIVKEVLANGRLTSRNADPRFVRKREILESCAGELGCTLDALAIAAALNQSWVDMVLSGAATVDQIRSNVSALNVTLNNAVQGRLAALAEKPAEYWQFRGTLAWN